MLVPMCLTHPSSLTHLHLVTLVVVASLPKQLGVFLHHHCNGYLTKGGRVDRGYKEIKEYAYIPIFLLTYISLNDI